jgi:simple sugar transport system ATP-binding protein
MMNKPFFELKNITKYFAKVIANKDVSFSIKKGEVLALLGENGAGKSTVMKILYGLYGADSGTILMDGVEQKIHSPKDAMALGISMIQQHFSLVPAHTVIENIILGNVHGRIDLKKHEEEIEALSKKHGFEVNPKAYIKDLPVGLQQKVEILKALYLNTKLLIMDEPTAVLTPQESENLMAFVRDFTAEGNSVIFITHKLKEVMEVADRIIVMRGGIVHGDLKRSETNEHELSRLMIGRDIESPTADGDIRKDGAVCLKLDHVTVKDDDAVARLSDITFEIKEGEVFGIAGVSGNGQQDLCEVIIGAAEVTEGAVYLKEEDITGLNIRERIVKGIGYVPADRHRDGMVMDMTLYENMLLKESYGNKWLKNGLVDHQALRAYTQSKIEGYQVKASGPDDLARSLSGGNQQKVIVAREVGSGGNLIVFNQPTRGLDLGAINHVHKTIFEERANGKGILLISTELSEIFALSDRIAIIYKGVIQGIFNRGELTTERIGLLMAGYTGDEEVTS